MRIQVSYIKFKEIAVLYIKSYPSFLHLDHGISWEIYVVIFQGNNSEASVS